ncbi:hypothetical protein HDC92_001008 [Pedobacter sp. AK017]|uniref:hypothetical protein n=1 Tax=Pedobacter sp. AK017 TaxID=2723073 RepID=UPI0016112556|nr:hypothetical protein [Pedobacter sp. AK017]MBB5437340.1 hypothetical protein [Pedobacter sp. AK017]
MKRKPKSTISKTPKDFIYGRGDGTFTTEDLIKMGLTGDEANRLMEQFYRDGVVKLIPS